MRLVGVYAILIGLGWALERPADGAPVTFVESAGTGRVQLRGWSRPAPTEGVQDGPARIRVELVSLRAPTQSWSGQLWTLDADGTRRGPWPVERDGWAEVSGGASGPRDLVLTVRAADGSAYAVETTPALRYGRTGAWLGRLGPVRSSPLPTLEVAWAAEGVVPDGRLDEAVWRRTESVPLTGSLGQAAPADRATTVRAAYDDGHLYLAFEAVDPDLRSRHQRRDDPVYRVEAVEVFLMPPSGAGPHGPYVELQVSPAGTVFDAAFRGPRRGMDLSFDADLTIGLERDGTLNDARPDRGWTTEWAIAWTSLPFVEAAPRPGDGWRGNFFRIDRSNRHDDAYLAWSPPRVGDFHRVSRFGHLRFGAVVGSLPTDEDDEPRPQ
jgi:hypothetical protein